MVQDAAGKFLFVINSGSQLTNANEQQLANCPQPPSGNFAACPSISVFSTSPGSTGATLTGNSPYWLDRIPTSLSVLTFTPPNGGTTQTLLFVTSKQDLTAAHNDN